MISPEQTGLSRRQILQAAAALTLAAVGCQTVQQQERQNINPDFSSILQEARARNIIESQQEKTLWETPREVPKDPLNHLLTRMLSSQNEQIKFSAQVFEAYGKQGRISPIEEPRLQGRGNFSLDFTIGQKDITYLILYAPELKKQTLEIDSAFELTVLASLIAQLEFNTQKLPLAQKEETLKVLSQNPKRLELFSKAYADASEAVIRSTGLGIPSKDFSAIAAEYIRSGKNPTDERWRNFIQTRVINNQTRPR